MDAFVVKNDLASSSKPTTPSKAKTQNSPAKLSSPKMKSSPKKENTPTKAPEAAAGPPPTWKTGIPLNVSKTQSVQSSNNASLLACVSPSLASSLDLKFSTVGAIGRFSANEKSVSLDMKGTSHPTLLQPSTTWMVCKVDSKTSTVTIETLGDEILTVLEGDARKRKGEDWDAESDDEVERKKKKKKNDKNDKKEKKEKKSKSSPKKPKTS
ncbi:hypothetical protein TrLO_g2165 [Triparma laevis f. longispina]|uniref:Uncharacterized protein n=1 Tax=Triparma laevis f. longispina TaxID=1714387 RepID=A0A9W7FVE5_9STRA|nr:hypothetical protein TrLO_g2165 [Triparma laevis f. longispina]